MSFPLLTVTAALPAAGALVTAALPAARRAAAKTCAMVFALATLALAITAAVRFHPGGAQYQLTESHRWIPSFGVHYQLGVDGIAVVLVLLTAVLVPVVMVASWHDADLDRDGPGDRRRPVGAYFGLMLMIEAMVVIAFESTDVFLFYVFFEAMLIPMYFLIGGFGQKYDGRAAAVGDTADGSSARRSRAAVKFLLYNLLGGLVMLAAVVGLYAQAHTFSVPAITAGMADGSIHVGGTAQKLIFLGFMFAFAVKAPLWPLHTWLPGAMGESTAGTAVLITAVVDKVGTFAMLRYCLQLFPDASKWATPVIVVLAVVSVLYGAILAVVQKDIKRLIAYASVSHFGFIILGIFALTSQGQSGAALYMVNHGISTAALMLVAGFLISRRGSAVIADFGGVQKTAPVLAGMFLVSGLAILSLPGLSPFVSEFLVLVGAFARYPAAGVAAAVGIVFAALYTLLLYQRTMTGPQPDGMGPIRELRVREAVAVVPLVALLLFLGVYPKPAMRFINPAVGHTMSALHEKDPKPAHPAYAAHTAGGDR